MMNELKKEFNEKYGRINEIRKVAEKMGHVFLFLTNKEIEDKLIKFSNYITIDINMYNIENNMITWYRSSDIGYVVIVDDGVEKTGMQLRNEKIMNDDECREFLCIE